MKTKILTLLTMFMFMLLAPTMATVANTFTINYNVQTTSFTVEITAMNINS